MTESDTRRASDVICQHRTFLPLRRRAVRFRIRVYASSLTINQRKAAIIGAAMSNDAEH